VAIVYFVILAVAFFFLIVLPQRRRVAAHRAFVASLAVGDEVITNGGIFGTIVGL
jgi:preprotein translocase subunit YajC